MSGIRSVVRIGLFPLIFIAKNAIGIAMISGGNPSWQRLLALLGAVRLMYVAE